MASSAIKHVGDHHRRPSSARDLPAGCCNLLKGQGPVTIEHVLLVLKVTKDEKESRFWGLFNFFDTSKAGYLDFVQIGVGLSVMQILTDYKYVKELLRVCDANRDGRVDYQEFRRYMDDKKLELYRIFQAIDVKHNGCILSEELYDTLVKAGIVFLPQAFPVTASFVISLLDQMKTKDWRSLFPSPIELLISAEILQIVVSNSMLFRHESLQRGRRR
uniref:EF-hand domain-containing protein n=1 Tax=Lactuca sativa TaxID=4236 RepID=A0A9R1WW69_LACSA|nr:hypothetical protein LSAT_V11C900473840 [Lactuca sativa]